MAATASPLQTHVLPGEYAILVLSGLVTEGCSWQLKDALLRSEQRDHGHVIVDVRQVRGMTREATRVLLWELGRAFDDGRTVRLVVRDVHQKRAMDGLGLAGMLPTHESLEDAIGAVDAAIASRRSR